MTPREQFLEYRRHIENGHIDPHLEVAAFAGVSAAFDRIEAALRGLGYKFWCENDQWKGRDVSQSCRWSLSRRQHAKLATLNERHGVPYTIRAAALHLGEIDFRQHPKQCNGDGPLAEVGMADPFVFEVDYSMETIGEQEDEVGLFEDLTFEFAPDGYHKADISGGSGYEVSLSDKALDPFVPLAGMTFLQLVDKNLSNGGFLGLDASDQAGPRLELPPDLEKVVRSASDWK